MKKKPKLHQARNLVALNPLLKKGGVNHQEDIDVVRKRKRREEKLKLNKTDWLKG
jgi:hypothetical protein